MEKKSIIAIFIVGVMVLSVFGFVMNYSTDQSKQKYNGYKFVQTPQGWQVNIEGKKFFFSNFPAQLEYLTLNDEAIKVLQNTNVLVVTYDPNSAWSQNLAQVQYVFEQMLAKHLTSVFVRRALTNSTNYSLPEINCENATATQPVLVFEESNKTQIVYEDYCFIAGASQEGALVDLAERVLFVLFGVME